MWRNENSGSGFKSIEAERGVVPGVWAAAFGLCDRSHASGPVTEPSHGEIKQDAPPALKDESDESTDRCCRRSDDAETCYRYVSQNLQ